MGLTAKHLAVGLVLAGYVLIIASLGALLGLPVAGLAAGVGLIAVGGLAIDVDRKAGRRG